MSENKELTINMDDMSSFFEWFFITSINNTDNEFINKILDNSVLNENGEIDGTHRIKMSINDIEVEPLAVINELQNQYDRIVTEKAFDIVNSILTDIEIDDFLAKLKEQIKIKLQK